LHRTGLPQTLLLAGPEGVGKATLARRLADGLLGGRDKIEQDDLSLPANLSVIEEREKWPASAARKIRCSSRPILTFSPSRRRSPAPDHHSADASSQGLAQFKPAAGARRVFLIDHLDRANEQAANSLLKTLEEPPEHLTLIVTAENAHRPVAHYPVARRPALPDSDYAGPDEALCRGAPSR